MEPSSLHRQVVDAIRRGEKAAALEYLRRDINTLIDETIEPAK